MAEDKNEPREKTEEQERKFSLRTIFYHNTFVLILSFCAALVVWFVMASGDADSNRKIADVPIEVTYSTAAEEDGLRVFNMTYNSADLEISGSNLITNKLTAADFRVTATLNPTSTKLTGNTLQKMTVKVRPEKISSVSDYNIVTVSPEEITLEYDRYKEITIPIENQVKYSADTGYASGSVTFSEETVTISGPESSINKISQAAVNYSVENPLRADESVTCPVRLYDQNNQEISDTAALYLELSVDAVEINIPILPKKTVSLVASTVRRPKSFPDARLVVEPAQIEIAGAAEVLASVNEITLDTAIDFTELDIGQKNVFTVDIPLPSGVRNLSASGENSVSQATVTVNLNGYKAMTVTAPAANIQAINRPAGREVVISSLGVDVTLIGPEAQVAKLTGDSLSVQVDLSNYLDSTGSVEVPATVSITGSSAESCWVLGKYTVALSLEDALAAQASAGEGSADPSDSGSGGAAARQAGSASSEEDAVVAAPQE